MQDPPNVVFILIDDMGWRDLSCYGSTFYETPNIDRLCARGMQFTNAYAACPVCSPTRASILTGKYPATLGLTDWIDESGRIHPRKGKLVDVPYIKHLSLEETTIASKLHEADYQTWHVGKWHLGKAPYYPEHHGFEVNIGGHEKGSPANGYFSPYGFPTLEDGPEGEYLTDRLTNEAIGLIRERDQERPFYLNLCYYTVHIPLEAKPEKIRKYEDKAKSLGLDKRNPFVDGEPYPFLDEEMGKQPIRRRIFQSDPIYAAMIESLDENVGRLVETLEETGGMNNTILVFYSDNGGLATAESSPTCNAPLAEGKGWTYEGGTREPLIVCWPGKVRAGSTCDTPVTSPDFFPTFMDAAGIPADPGLGVEGESLMPLLRETGGLKREAIFWHYPHYGNQGGTPGSAIRLGDYKLIEFFEDGRLELYNLVEDISEEENLAQEMPELTRCLHEKLITWRNSVAAKIPGRNPDYGQPGKDHD